MPEDFPKRGPRTAKDRRALHPKQKGNLGEARVAAELIGLGYPVFVEFGDLSRIDMLVEVPSRRIVRLQIKCLQSHQGAVVVDAQKTGPSYRFRYRVDDVDLFAIYVYDRDVVLYVPSSLICGTRRRTTFRLDPARNGQEDRIRAASEFSDFDAAVQQVWTR